MDLRIRSTFKFKDIANATKFRSLQGIPRGIPNQLRKVRKVNAFTKKEALEITNSNFFKQLRNNVIQTNLIRNQNPVHINNTNDFSVSSDSSFSDEVSSQELD